MLTDTQKKALQGKLDPTHVRTREQAGQTLSYIEAWRVIDVANSIFGFDGWTRETVEMQEVRPPELIIQQKTGRNGPYTTEHWHVGFMAKVRVVVGTVVREGTGFGSGISKQLEDAYESAVKEAESDAMKRAMMTFGNPFGLALYDKTQANVGVDAPPVNDRNSVIADTLIEAATNAEDTAALKAWKERQLPEIQALDEVNRKRVTTALTEIWNSLTKAENLRAG
jgi:DNA repair and recombination protein RAD52